MRVSALRERSHHFPKWLLRHVYTIPFPFYQKANTLILYSLQYKILISRVRFNNSFWFWILHFLVPWLICLDIITISFTFWSALSICSPCRHSLFACSTSSSRYTDSSLRTNSSLSLYDASNAIDFGKLCRFPFLQH